MVGVVDAVEVVLVAGNAVVGRIDVAVLVACHTVEGNVPTGEGELSLVVVEGRG